MSADSADANSAGPTANESSAYVVELLRVLAQRRVAALADCVHNAAGSLEQAGGLALGGALEYRGALGLVERGPVEEG